MTLHLIPQSQHAAVPAPLVEKDQSRAPRLSSSNDMPRRSTPHIPAGFYFPAFPKVLQCAVCLAPWRCPVTFHPCLHTVCSGCTFDDHSQCPSCGLPSAGFTQPPQELVSEALAVPIACESCAWQGTIDQGLKHTCRARQHSSAIRLLERDPHNAKAWFMLGASMQNGSESAEVRGKRYTKVDCYVKSIKLNCNDAAAWGNLAAVLDPTATVTINGHAYRKRQCAVRCLNLDPNSPIPWFNLGNMMQRGEIEDIRGVRVHKDTCYVRAVQLNPRMHAAWHNLGLCLDRGTVIDINDREYDASMCFITAVLINPFFAEAWSKLAIVGPERRIFHGKRWTPKECAAKALTLNKTLSEPWILLNRIMTKPDEVVEVGSRVYTKQQVEKRAAVAALAPPQRPQTTSEPQRSASGSSRGSSSCDTATPTNGQQLLAPPSCAVM